jgi:hypothetical protein
VAIVALDTCPFITAYLQHNADSEPRRVLMWRQLQDAANGTSQLVWFYESLRQAARECAAVVAVNLPLSLTASGSTITVKRDGVSVISVTDTSITSAGYFGCGVNVTYGSDSWVFNSIGQVTIQTA